MSAPGTAEIRSGKPGDRVHWWEKEGHYYRPFEDEEPEVPKREGTLISWAGAMAWVQLDSGETLGVLTTWVR